MKNIVVKVLNEKFDVVKVFDGFEDWDYARWFAKNEAEWRGMARLSSNSGVDKRHGAGNQQYLLIKTKAGSLKDFRLFDMRKDG